MFIFCEKSDQNRFKSTQLIPTNYKIQKAIFSLKKNDIQELSCHIFNRQEKCQERIGKLTTKNIQQRSQETLFYTFRSISIMTEH